MTIDDMLLGWDMTELGPFVIGHRTDRIRQTSGKFLLLITLIIVLAYNGEDLQRFFGLASPLYTRVRLACN